MFHNTTSLVGGMGTVYNESNPTDKTYAHIDDGPSNPGYFTASGTVAYVCYTPENTTLSFYYDNKIGSRPGGIYTIEGHEPGIPMWITARRAPMGGFMICHILSLSRAYNT